MNRRGAILLILLAAATPDVKYFRYERTLVVPAQPSAATAARQACAALDAGIYANAAPGLTDVRLYRTDAPAGMTETPFVIREQTPPEPQPREIAPLNLGRKGVHTTFEAAMPEGRYSDVELDISAKDFIATVAVTGAQDESGREGTELGLFTIFDLTAQKLGRSTVLHLPESDLRYLYFSIDGAVKPGDVHGVSVERVAAKTQYVTVAATNQVVQKGKETVATFSVAPHVPVERVEFAVGPQPANFSRAVTVRAKAVPVAPLRTDEEPPDPVEMQANVLRIHTVRDAHRIDEEELAVDAPQGDFGSAGSEWTVVIDNGDDTPLPIDSVRLEMAERKLCFDAVSGAEYTLMYGDTALEAPRYDYATLFAPETNAAMATFGKEQLNPRYAKRPDTRPFTERYPWLLWVALLVVVSVLGLVALKTAKTAGTAH